MTPGTVMLSGANRGIGLAIARRLAADGWRLSVGVRTPSGDLPDGAFACAYDARDRSAAARWVAATIARFGGVDALVNNAGVLRPLDFDVPADGDDDALDEMIEVNAVAPFRLTRAAFPHLRASRGRVVDVVSVSGVKATGGDEAGYGVSKFAAAGASAIARAAGTSAGIRVTTIHPGWVDTAMGPGPLPGVLRPDDVAACVAYVLSLPASVDLPEIVLNDTIAPEAT